MNKGSEKSLVNSDSSKPLLSKKTHLILSASSLLYALKIPSMLIPAHSQPRKLQRNFMKRRLMVSNCTCSLHKQPAKDKLLLKGNSSDTRILKRSAISLSRTFHLASVWKKLETSFLSMVKQKASEFYLLTNQVNL